LGIYPSSFCYFILEEQKKFMSLFMPLSQVAKITTEFFV